MGFFEAFADELDKIAVGAPPVAAAAKSTGMVTKAREWVKKNPGKSGIALGWFLRGVMGGGNRE